MSRVTRVQILDEVVHISHRANIHWKGINPTILPQAQGKLSGKLGVVGALPISP